MYLFQYKPYTLRTNTLDACHVRLCDTPGLHEDSDFGLQEMKLLLDGHVPDNYRVKDIYLYWFVFFNDMIDIQRKPFVKCHCKSKNKNRKTVRPSKYQNILIWFSYCNYIF